MRPLLFIWVGQVYLGRQACGSFAVLADSHEDMSENVELASFDSMHEAIKFANKLSQLIIECGGKAPSIEIQ